MSPSRSSDSSSPPNKLDERLAEALDERLKDAPLERLRRRFDQLKGKKKDNSSNET